LVTKGTDEPYRIMTSRAEFRLVLRQDNADLRLTQKGFDIGLASPERYARYLKNKQETEDEIERLKTVYVSPEEATAFLEHLHAPAAEEADSASVLERRRAIGKISGRISLAALLKRPGVTHENLRRIDTARPQTSAYARKQAEIQLKYEGYIDKQQKQIERFKKLENKRIPDMIDYTSLRGLRLEAVQKLNDIKPSSVGQASRISGVSPADIGVLLIHLERMKD
jgi:tRNA uridine 5-carboxymethylaminomethyl modification enzyme